MGRLVLSTWISEVPEVPQHHHHHLRFLQVDLQAFFVLYPSGFILHTLLCGEAKATSSAKPYLLAMRSGPILCLFIDLQHH